MEGFTILEEISPRSLERVLEEEAIELDQANLELARELVLGNLNISREDFYQLKELKDKVDFIKSKLSREDLFRYWDEDILNMDLDRLIEIIELEGDKTQPGKVNGLEVGLKELSDLEARSREVDLSFLDGLKIEDLFEIIKSGENFKLEDLENIVEGRLGEEESIDFTILERTLEINTIFKQLGEELPNLDLKQGLDTSLKDLYQASLDLKDLDFRPVWSRELDLIRAEYSKFKVNIDIRTLKDSLKQELDLVELPLREANAYIDGKINRYREVAQLMEEFNSIYKHRNIILPLVIKNGLNMDYRQLRNLSNFLSGKDSLNKLVEENLREGRFEKPEELIGLREKISNCLKEGEDIRQDYFKFMDFFASSGGSMNSGGDNPYFKNQEEASQEDLLLQIPLEIDGFKDLNLFIVKGKASLDKNHMNFKLNIETEDLGHIFMDLEVLGKNIRLSLNEESKLNKYMTILEDMFETRGYNLEIGD